MKKVVDVNTMSIQELKVMFYDMKRDSDRLIQNLNMIVTEIDRQETILRETISEEVIDG